MGLSQPYEPRYETEYGADKIINIWSKQRLCLLTVDTGGGKTFMAIRAAAKSNPNMTLIVLTTKKQIDDRHWENSIDSYNETMHSHLNYYVTNYEQIIMEKNYKPLLQKLNVPNQQPVCLILDEVHMLKGFKKSARSNIAINLSKHPLVKRTLGLTATPTSNSILDTCSYLLMNQNYQSRTQFLNEHVYRFDDYFNPVIKRRDGTIDINLIKNYQKLVNELKAISVNIDTESLLPPVKRWEKHFTFDTKTQKRYRKIINDYQKGEYDSIQTALSAQRTFVAEHNQQRVDYIVDLIKNPQRVNKPILIFYQYIAERDALIPALSEKLPDYHQQIISGDMKKAKKLEPENPKTIVFIQYQAGGAGINAQWSSFTIFYSPTNSWQNFKQAWGRNRRAGQKGTVFQVRLVVDKTINAHMWNDVIDSKQKFNTHLKEKILNKGLED